MNTSRKGINLEETNGMWKGDDVGQSALHEWIKNRKPKLELCENCQKRKVYDLANISGEYKRDINDYEWLCRKCHMAQDGRAKRLRFTGKHTKEARLRMSKKMKKHFEDKEFREKWIAARKGKKTTERFKGFMSEFVAKRERDKRGRFISMDGEFGR